MTVCLCSWGALTPAGILVPEGLRPWDQGRSGVETVRREQVLEHPFPPFGKLPLAERLAFAAASLALHAASAVIDTECALYAGVTRGSVSTDIHYIESLRTPYPSPAHFSATLPSSVIAEIAIYYRIKGANRVFVGPANSCQWALFTAFDRVHRAASPAALVVLVDCVEPQHRARMGVQGAPAALALLLCPATEPRAERTFTLSAAPAQTRGSGAPIDELAAFLLSGRATHTVHDPGGLRSLLIAKEPVPCKN